MVMTYDGALTMPCSYAVMDEEEKREVGGEGTKTYYNKAGTLKNTCSLLKEAWIIQNIAYASAGCGISMTGGIIAAYICGHNAEMMAQAVSLCERYTASTYITLTINSTLTWINSVSAKRGK